MRSIISQSVRRLTVQSSVGVQRRLLFGWIPDKVKHLIVPDKRTDKEKFLEQTQKEQMKKIDEKIDEAVQIDGVFGFLIKSLMKRTGRATVKEMSRLSVDSQEVIGMAESLVVNDPRVRKTYGDDVQFTGMVGMKSDTIMDVKEVETMEVIVAIDGSRKSGTVRLVAQKNAITDEMKIFSITVNDGHNEFEVAVNQNFSPPSKSNTDARVIDVKARDD